MTSDQPLTLTVTPALAWHRAVAGAGALTVLVMSAWVLAWVCAAHALPIDVLVAAMAGSALALPACLSRRGAVCGPILLGWDGQNWFLAEPARGRESPEWTGQLSLVLKLPGVWLLRTRGGGPTRWLPVDARQLGPQGHPLLCALYCARRA